MTTADVVPETELSEPPSPHRRTNDSIRVRPLGDVGGELVHPVYLNTPMMASFYASLGLAIDQERLSADVEAAEKQGAVAGSAKAGLPDILDFVAPFKVGLEGEFRIAGRHEESIALRSIFQHTEASLFNRLRHALTEHRRILCLDDPSESQLDQKSDRPLEVGCLLEVTGQIVRNPLDQILATYVRIAPFARAEASRRHRRKERPSFWRRLWGVIQPPTLEDDRERVLNSDPSEAEFVTAMKEDLELAGVRDLVMTPDGSDGVSVIIVASSEFFSERTAEYLLDGRFTVLGKVTSIFLGSEDRIDLTRRTALGVSGQARAQKVVDSVVKKYNLGGRRSPGGSGNRSGKEAGQSARTEADGAVMGPAIQILPLAVFV